MNHEDRHRLRDVRHQRRRRRRRKRSRNDRYRGDDVAHLDADAMRHERAVGKSSEVDALRVGTQLLLQRRDQLPQKGDVVRRIRTEVAGEVHVPLGETRQRGEKRIRIGDREPRGVGLGAQSGFRAQV